MSAGKPFARVEPYAGPDGDGFQVPPGFGTHAVLVNTPDGDRCVWPGTEPYARSSVDRINAAVEQREAPLRAALLTVSRLLAPAKTAPLDQFYEYNPAALVRLADLIARTLGDSPPEYVPKAEVDALAAKLKAAMVIIDSMEAGRRADVVPFLVAAGLKKPTPVSELSDGELSAQNNVIRNEARRRGWMDSRARRGSVPPPCAHCNNLPYVGPLPACPECGIDRHGVGHGAG